MKASDHKPPRMMKQMMRKFWRDEEGQDLIEYTLLMAFVALASATLFLGAGNSIIGIWTSANTLLSVANTHQGGDK